MDAGNVRKLVKEVLTTSDSDLNGKSSVNVADGLVHIGNAIFRLADAVTTNVGAGKDATGGLVGCVTESIMGVTGGLVQVAEAVRDLASAVREHPDAG